jgi:hypothetical protein
MQHEQKLSVAASTDSHPFFTTPKSLLSNLKRDFSSLHIPSSLASSTSSSQKYVLVQEPTDNEHTPEDIHHEDLISKTADTDMTDKISTDKSDTKVTDKIASSEFQNNPQNPSVVGGGEEEVERKGLLKCDGQYVDSEVIYWKIVPGDDTYESPITPHHDMHHDRYLTYEYDEGGWNNIRMSLECVLVFTHAMGRTLVSPPRQNLYLVDKKYKAEDGTVRSGMGFEDFFDMELLMSHKGYHVMTSEQFLAKEGVSGGLHGVLPPKNSTQIGGRKYTILVMNEDLYVSYFCKSSCNFTMM